MTSYTKPPKPKQPAGACCSTAGCRRPSPTPAHLQPGSPRCGLSGILPTSQSMSELKSQVYYDELLREMDLRYSWSDTGRVVESNPVVEAEAKPKLKPAAPEHGSNARYSGGC